MASDSPENRLLIWLNRLGLWKNPFDVWNVERDPELPNYFVDMAQFAELQRLSDPCIVFAQRGCGKTAQRQMLAAQCRPSDQTSSWLAVPYTYAGFEQALTAVSHDPADLRAEHHVSALLRQGLQVLESQVRQDRRLSTALRKSGLTSRLSAYLACYVHAQRARAGGSKVPSLELLTTAEMLEGFAELARAAGFQRVLILVDGLDELPLTADRPTQMAALLAPLLGTLRLIECPGLAWKFFLPQTLEPVLRGSRWFRADRVRLFRISWAAGDIMNLIGQRLTYASAKGDRTFTRLGQLCQEGLRSRIDVELAARASGIPRAALVLAEMLLRAHCEQPELPDLISATTWETVQARWAEQRADFIDEPGETPRREPAPSALLDATLADSEWQVLRVDEACGQVWLGDRDITTSIRKKDFQVLQCLYRHQHAMCDKDILWKEAWSEADKEGITDAQIAAAIARLRKNLGQFDPFNGYIETIKGRGYRLHPKSFHSKPQR